MYNGSNRTEIVVLDFKKIITCYNMLAIIHVLLELGHV